LHPLFEQDKRIDQFGISEVAKKFNRRERYIQETQPARDDVQQPPSATSDF
jgi:hypothetical protein